MQVLVSITTVLVAITTKHIITKPPNIKQIFYSSPLLFDFQRLRSLLLPPAFSPLFCYHDKIHQNHIINTNNQNLVISNNHPNLSFIRHDPYCFSFSKRIFGARNNNLILFSSHCSTLKRAGAVMSTDSTATTNNDNKNVGKKSTFDEAIVPVASLKDESSSDATFSSKNNNNNDNKQSKRRKGRKKRNRSHKRELKKDQESVDSSSASPRNSLQEILPPMVAKLRPRNKKKKKLESLQDIFHKQRPYVENVISLAQSLHHTTNGHAVSIHRGKDLSKVKIVTTCFMPTEQSSDLQVTTIYIKPLLVLDINGILCHRLKGEDYPASRKSIGTIASSRIIPRNDIHEFLDFLSEHFCLAIWTSAQDKACKSMLRLLLPPTIRESLLFTWVQRHCHIGGVEQPPPKRKKSKKDSYNKVLYQKLITKIYNEYNPFWNQTNTILMDDSPAKCPEYPQNTLHPPSINGRKWMPFGEDPATWMLDSKNESYQMEFFKQLVEYWKEHPLEQIIMANDDSNETTVTTATTTEEEATSINESCNQGLYDFLKEHGSDHMGWRGDVQHESEE